MSYNEEDTLPQYRVPEEVTYESLSGYLKNILKLYQNGSISLNDINNHGDSINTFIWNKYGDPEEPIYPSFPEDHSYSIPLEVMSCMGGHFISAQNIDLLTEFGFEMLPQDVPHFIEFLDTPRGKEKEGWKRS